MNAVHVPQVWYCMSLLKFPTCSRSICVFQRHSSFVYLFLLNYILMFVIPLLIDSFENVGREWVKLKMFPWTVCIPNVSLVSWFILYSLHGHTSFDINNYLTTQATPVLPCTSVNLGKKDDLFMIQAINRQIKALKMVQSFWQSFIALQSNTYLNK